MLGSGPQRAGQRAWPNPPPAHSNGNTSGGIPVGIAVPRQRVQSSPPPPLTVVTCEERSTNHVGWPSLAPPHWHYPGVDEVPMGLQLARDPLSGQLLLVPSPIGISSSSPPYPMQLQPSRRPLSFDGMERALVWPPGSFVPPVQLMQPPLLLDRLVALEKRHLDPTLTSVMLPCDFSKSSNVSVSNPNPSILSQGQSSQGLLIHSLGPTPQQQFPSLLIHQMPQNNSVVLSTQLTAEQSLNTSVVISSNQLSENGVLSPQVLGGGLEGAGNPLLHHHHHHPSSLVISHTETTNSFVRSDINTVFPLVPEPPSIIIKEEQIKPDIEEKITLLDDKATSPPTDLSPPPETTSQLGDEETKESGGTCVQDASNQTETPTSSDEESTTMSGEKINLSIVEAIVPVKKEELESVVEGEGFPTPPPDEPPSEQLLVVKCEEKKEIAVGVLSEPDAGSPQPDLSGLELLSNSIVQYESVHHLATGVADVGSPPRTPPPSPSQEAVGRSSSPDSLFGGLGLLCELAHQRFIEETQNRATASEPPDEEAEEVTSEHIARRIPPPPVKEKDHLPNGNSEHVLWKTQLKLTQNLKPLCNGNAKVSPVKIVPKKKPGRPRKSPSRTVKRPRSSVSPVSSEPPVLERCASPDFKDAPRLSPPTLTPNKRKSMDSPSQDSDSSANGKPPPLSPACSSSKKRKVGRPKKRAEKPVQTETIVSKPLRCSKTIVGLLLANQAMQTEVTKPKIRPKLKAEAKVKAWCDDDELDWSPTKENHLDGSLSDNYLSDHQSWSYKSKEKLPSESVKKPKIKSPTEKKAPVKPVKVLAPKFKRVSTEKPAEDLVPMTNQESKTIKPADAIPECTLRIEHLDKLPCRVLVAMGGLFYAGQLTEVTPPDLYGVTLDKERGHKPHIFCREQILTDAVLEVHANGLKIPAGTRLCAYWSQQYRCLYPGTVCAESMPEEKFVCVEFDDGDNGKINKDDIRLLPKNYPIVEYDPNPLLSLGKRKRHNSTNSCDSLPKLLETPEPLTPEVCREPLRPEEKVKPIPVLTKAESPKTPRSEPLTKLVIQSGNREPLKMVVNKEPSSKVILSVANSLTEEAPPPPPKLKVKSKREELTADNLAKAQNGTDELQNKVGDLLPCLNSIESDLERRRLKKKRKEKLKQKLLESGCDIRKHRHKHRESCKTRHKHKHKHRHRKHKHKHLKPLEQLDLVIENAANKVESPTQDSSQEEEEEESVLTPIGNNDTEKKGGAGNRKNRQGSVESKSKMAAFLPARQLWGWAGKGLKRGGGGRGRKKIFYKSIQRGKEAITIGDCAVFLSTGRPDRPYIGRIESMWECWGSNMQVKVSWFYHPEETIGCPDNLPYPGALFESPHNDENDVQTISHKCEVLPLEDYKGKLSECPQFLETVYDNNDTYYLAGYYDPTNTTLRLEPGIEPK